MICTRYICTLTEFPGLKFPSAASIFSNDVRTLHIAYEYEKLFINFMCPLKYSWYIKPVAIFFKKFKYNQLLERASKGVALKSPAESTNISVQISGSQYCMPRKLLE
jgi:hypothetical protein